MSSLMKKKYRKIPNSQEKRLLIFYSFTVGGGMFTVGGGVFTVGGGVFTVGGACLQ